MKTRLNNLTACGLILSCFMLLSSCAELACMNDRNKLGELERQHQQGLVSNRDYKQEKGRLEREIRENVDFIKYERGPLVTITYTPPANGGDSGAVDSGE